MEKPRFIRLGPATVLPIEQVSFVSLGPREVLLKSPALEVRFKDGDYDAIVRWFDGEYGEITTDIVDLPKLAKDGQAKHHEGRTSPFRTRVPVKVYEENGKRFVFWSSGEIEEVLNPEAIYNPNLPEFEGVPIEDSEDVFFDNKDYLGTGEEEQAARELLIPPCDLCGAERGTVEPHACEKMYPAGQEEELEKLRREVESWKP